MKPITIRFQDSADAAAEAVYQMQIAANELRHAGRQQFSSEAQYVAGQMKDLIAKIRYLEEKYKEIEKESK